MEQISCYSYILLVSLTTFPPIGHSFLPFPLLLRRLSLSLVIPLSPIECQNSGTSPPRNKAESRYPPILFLPDPPRNHKKSPGVVREPATRFPDASLIFLIKKIPVASFHHFKFFPGHSINTLQNLFYRHSTAQHLSCSLSPRFCNRLLYLLFYNLSYLRHFNPPPDFL